MTISGPPARAYVLDTGVIIAFQRADQLTLLARAAEHAPLIVVEEVRDVTDQPSRDVVRARA